MVLAHGLWHLHLPFCNVIVLVISLLGNVTLNKDCISSQDHWENLDLTTFRHHLIYASITLFFSRTAVIDNCVGWLLIVEFSFLQHRLSPLHFQFFSNDQEGSNYLQHGFLTCGFLPLSSKGANPACRLSAPSPSLVTSIFFWQ